MEKTKSLFYKLLMAEIILLTLFVISTLLGNGFLCNILTPVISAAAAGLLVYAYTKSANKKTIGISLVIFALGCLAWSLSDTLWAIYFVAGQDPEQNLLLSGFYAITNTAFAVSVLIFLLYQFNKWNGVQLLIDTLAVGVSGCLLFWIVFFRKSDIWFIVLTQDGVLSTLMILIDFLIVIGVFLGIFWTRQETKPLYVYIMGAGVTIFSINDLICYYQSAYGLYIANSMIDCLYMTSFLIIAAGALWRVFIDPRDRTEDISYTKNNKYFLLLIFPLIAILFNNCTLKDVFDFAFLIVFYQALSTQVQLAIKNDLLLKTEIDINTKLEERVEEQFSELHFLANHDMVTRLYNRHYFLHALQTAMETRQGNEILALFVIDVDRFKTINDTFGHDIGDKVLVELGNRMATLNNNGRLIARLGGDEFGFLCKGEYGRSELSQMAKQLTQICSEPINIGQNVLNTTISIGICLFPEDADTCMALMKNADLAMYHAKACGYNRHVFFDPFFKVRNDKKNEVEVLLRKANVEKDFELFYQPQFSLPDHHIIGAEALICWKNNERGYISANEFIPVAEEINYIIKIGKWVMREAIHQVVKWNTKYALDLKMGINISPKQLYEDDFIATLKTLILNDHADSTWIDAEITENVMIEDGNKVDTVFDMFKELCVSVSIDDFGCGYSSWNNLNKYPYDRIKIDKTLIDNIRSNNNGGVQAVKAIIAMANAMGKQTIAEGVETQEQLDILTELDCHQVQGFLLGRPVSAQVFEDMFINNAMIIHNWA